MATAKAKTTNTTSIRLDPAFRNRLEALARRMGERAGGIELPLATAMRAALERGIAELESELGMKRARRQ